MTEDTFRGQLDSPKLLQQHLFGERLDQVRHMCPEPECVKPDPVFGEQRANPLCPVCCGAGSVTGDRLERWQTEQLLKARKGEL